MDRPFLEIAKTIGEPINPSLPVPVEIRAIANLETADPHEKVWSFQAYDTDNDEILDVESDGSITVQKRDAIGDTELTFKGLNSQLEYVLVDAVLASVDKNLLGRKKGAIARGLDKREVKMILDGIMSPTSASFPATYLQSVTKASGEDLYDVIQKAIHKLEDYGDGFVLLAGTEAKEAIDKYDKEKAGSHNYKVDLKGFLRDNDVKVLKIFGKVAVTDGGALQALLDAKAMILLATNSRIADGKPITFVRRRISPEIAKLMGANVDEAQRANIVNPVPVQASGNKLAYGVYAYESIIFAITNPKAICKCDDVVS